MALRYLTALVGGVLTVLGLSIRPASVEAKPALVRIESQPSGATIYLDSKDRDPLGKTPYLGKLPAGPHTLIIELEGYVAQVQDITVRRRRKPPRILVKLNKIELATLEILLDKNPGISQPDVKAGRIVVDGKEMGNLPDPVQVPAGPHQVEVVVNGYKTFETWVEATGGETLSVAAELIPSGAAPRGIAGTRGGREEIGAEDRNAEKVPDARRREGDGREPRVASREPGAVAAAPGGGSVDGEAGDHGSRRPAPFIEVGAGVELAGRRFRPNAQEVQGLRAYDAAGVPMLRLLLEVNPLAFSTSRWLSGWGLFAHYGRARAVSTARLEEDMEVEVPTDWSELDFGLRYRYAFEPGTFIGVQAGYGNQTFTFDIDDQAQELSDQVPDVDYGFWRFGAEGRLGFGRFAALASGGTRLVSSIGNLGDRFAQTDVLAFDAALGLAAAVTRSIEARLIGRYEHYAHEYTAMPSGPGVVATTGLDQFFGAMLSAVFSY